MKPTRLRATALLFAACVAASSVEADVEAGRVLYRQLCARCHGPDMENSGRSAIDLRIFPKDQTERFYSSLIYGRGAMPAWGDILRPGELDALWSYVASRGENESLPDTESGALLTTPELATGAEGTLRVCLARDGGVMSGRRILSGGAGFDYLVSRELAARLGRKLEVTWIESEADGESQPDHETYAMLAYDLCDLVAGHPLYAPALGEPPVPRAAVPRWMGMPERWTRELSREVRTAIPTPFVELEAIATTRPYARVEMAVVYAPGIIPRNISSLNQLTGLRLGIQEGTLAGVLTLRQTGSEVLSRSITVNPGPAFLWNLENGQFDAALVAVPEFDFHRLQNPISEITLGDWRHPLGFNIAFTALASRRALLPVADAAIAEMIVEGRLPTIATQAGLHYAEPREPLIQPPLSLSDLDMQR